MEAIIIGADIADVIRRALACGRWTAEQAGARAYSEAHARRVDLSPRTAAWAAGYFRCDSNGFVRGWRAARDRDQLHDARALGVAYIPLPGISVG